MNDNISSEAYGVFQQYKCDSVLDGAIEQIKSLGFVDFADFTRLLLARKNSLLQTELEYHLV